MTERVEPPGRARRILLLLTLLGAFLTVRGYRCLDGDQAYRFPVLLHAEHPALFQDDPFVRSFDRFNPHKGSFLVIGLAARPFGLAAGLWFLFLLTFFGTALGIGRLTCATWPELGRGVGVVAFGAVLAALAGNIGTNHLFEPILLDRLMALALGWVAIGMAVASTDQRVLWSVLPIGLAVVIHPTVGLQLAILLAASWVCWLGLPRSGRAGPAVSIAAISGLVLAAIPGVVWNLAHSGQLLDGLSAAEFRKLSLELQGPQHMLPHLWRMPQWLAWACYPALAAVALVSSRDGNDKPPARARLLVMLGLNLVGLALAWYCVERVEHLSLTLFQPFRMATVARGLCLVVLSGHLVQLLGGGGIGSRTRVLLLLTGLAGDWMLVVVTTFEIVMMLVELAPRFQTRLGLGEWWVALRLPTLLLGYWDRLLPWLVLGIGLVYLSRHDTESGHLPLLAAAIVGLLGFHWLKVHPVAWTRGRQLRVAVMAWVIPLVALAGELTPADTTTGWRATLARRCRFTERPADDIERLAVWCRTHTPRDARFIGPPGQKTFRLWSRRSLAFNRAASPYNARGLADWAERYRDHVGFRGSLDEFVAAYMRDRHALESGYDRMSGEDLAALADRQGAKYVVAQASDTRLGPLVRLYAERAWSVYCRPEVARGTGPMIGR